MDCDILQASAGIRLGNIKSMPCNANWLATLIISLGSALALNAVRLTDLNIQEAEEKREGVEEEDCHIHSARVFKETRLADEKFHCVVILPRGDNIREQTFCFN